MNSKRVRVICPGQKLPIRPQPNKYEKEVGYVKSGDEVEIFLEEKAGYYRLADGRGYLNKNSKNVEWREVDLNTENQVPLRPAVPAPLNVASASAPAVSSNGAGAAVKSPAVKSPVNAATAPVALVLKSAPITTAPVNTAAGLSAATPLIATAVASNSSITAAVKSPTTPIVALTKTTAIVAQTLTSEVAKTATVSPTTIPPINKNTNGQPNRNTVKPQAINTSASRTPPPTDLTTASPTTTPRTLGAITDSIVPSFSDKNYFKANVVSSESDDLHLPINYVFNRPLSRIGSRVNSIRIASKNMAGISNEHLILEQERLLIDIAKLKQEREVLQQEIYKLKGMLLSDDAAPPPLENTSRRKSIHEINRKNLNLSSNVTLGAMNVNRRPVRDKDDVNRSENKWEEYDVTDKLSFTKQGPEKIDVITPPTASATSKPMNTAASIAARASAIDLFLRNLKMFKNRLKEGIPAYIWEGEYVIRLEVTVKADAKNEYIVFEQASSIFSIFTRVDVPSLSARVTEIFECVAGADVDVPGVDDQLKRDILMTIMSKNSDNTSSRMIGLELQTLEDRNSLLTGLRTLVSELHMVQAIPIGARAANVEGGSNDKTQSRLQAFQPQKSNALMNQRGNLSGQDIGSRRPTIGSSDERTSFSSVSSSLPGSAHVSINGIQNLTADKSKVRQKDSELYDNFDTTTSLATLSKPIQGSNKLAKLTKSSSYKSYIPNNTDTWADTVREDSELQNLLMIERISKEKITVQMLMLTNDLHERDDQIADIKEREDVLEDNLQHLERLYVAAAEKCEQLHKSLIDAEGEREDAMIEMETMKEQLDLLKMALANKK